MHPYEPRPQSEAIKYFDVFTLVYHSVRNIESISKVEAAGIYIYKVDRGPVRSLRQVAIDTAVIVTTVIFSKVKSTSQDKRKAHRKVARYHFHQCRWMASQDGRHG